MHIVLLGPPCPCIEMRLAELGHAVTCLEGPLTMLLAEDRGFEFGVSYRYKRIVNPDVIEHFGGRLINMHISLLPWNRGYDPNLWSYLEETPAGVTIHRMDSGIDTGDILLQRRVDMDFRTDTLRTSYRKLSVSIEELFTIHAEDILTEAIKPRMQRGPGSFHLASDKNRFLHLLEPNGWDTPVRNLLGRGKTFGKHS